jgi:hypothetical protein
MVDPDLGPPIEAGVVVGHLVMDVIERTMAATLLLEAVMRIAEETTIERVVRLGVVARHLLTGRSGLTMIPISPRAQSKF